MKQFWNWIKKYWWLALPSFLILIGWGALYLIRRNVNFNFNIDKDMSGVINSLHSRMENPQTSESERGIGVYLDVPLKTTVNNDSISPLSLKNVMGTISYNGETILQSKADSPVLENVKVDAKSKLQLTDSYQVLINESSIKFFKELIKGNKPIIDYKIKENIFGIPYSFAKSAVVNEEGKAENNTTSTEEKPN